MKFHSIEPLEPRIAPAAIFTFTDVDGDTVQVKTSKGTNAQLAAAITLANAGIGKQLQEIDFSSVPLVNGANPFAGTSLTVIVTNKAPLGNGQVHVGYIDASNLNGAGTDGAGLALGAVRISGDLGQIDAGVGGFGPALKSLQVQSIGAFGTKTQGMGGSNASNLLGSVGSFKVAGSVINSTIALTAPTTNFSIGLELDNSTITGSGDVKVMSLGSVLRSTITVNSLVQLNVRDGVISNAPFTPTVISVNGTLTKAKIGGDLVGSNILANNIGTLALGGSVIGIDGYDDLGQIIATEEIKSVTIGGSLIAGDASNSAVVRSGGNTGTIQIRQSMVGPVVGGDQSASNSAQIAVGGNLGSFSLGGDMVGPTPRAGVNEPQATGCSSIFAIQDIGKVTIGGSMIGVLGMSTNSFKNLSITGQHLGSLTVDGSLNGNSIQQPSIMFFGGDGRAAIESVTIRGGMNFGKIVGGITESYFGAPATADAQIGLIKIGGNVINSKIQTLAKGAGVADNASLIGKIAQVQIGGILDGTTSIRAEELGKVIIGGNSIKLTAGARNDTNPITFAPGTGSLAEYSM